MKEAYIEEINQLINNTDDLSLLDFVYQLLAKSVKGGMIMINRIKFVIQDRIDKYNRAYNNCNFNQEREYYNELVGMQKILEAIGFKLYFEKTVDGLTYELE